MSAASTLSALDASVHKALLDAKLADLGEYLPPGAAPGAPVTVCRVFLNRNTQVIGEVGQVVALRDEVAVLLEDVEPLGRSTIKIDGTKYLLGDHVGVDGGWSRWVVRRV